jgi:hypothetical protein
MGNAALALPNEEPNKLPSEIQAINAEVKSLSITNPQSYQSASDLMIRIRKTRKQQEDALKAKLKPYKDQIKAEQDRANIGLVLLHNCETQLQRSILDYQRRAREEADRAQRKEQEKHDKKVAKAEAKAEATGQPMPIIAPPPVIAAPSSHVKTESGALTSVKVKKWRVKFKDSVLTSDEVAGLKRDDPRVKEIPDCFFGLVTAEITRLVKAIGQPGQPVPGCSGIEVFEEETLAVK